jgi:hypothetical protein
MEMAKKISLEELVVFSYLDNNDIEIPVSGTVKSLIDDWFGECELLGANDCPICETNIVGMEMSGATIEDLMEYLVKETGYSSPEIDEKAKDLLKYYDSALVVGLNEDGSNRMVFETKGEIDTIDMLVEIVEGYAVENELSVQHILDEMQQKIAQKNS